MDRKIIITLLFVILTIIFGVGFYYFFFKEKINNEANNNFSTLPVTNNNDNVVDLPDFRELVSENSSPEHELIIDNIYTDEYYIRVCGESKNKTNSLILVAKYKPDSNNVNSFSQAQLALSNFEETIYNDWGTILYNENFIPTSSNTKFITRQISDEHIMAESYREGVINDVSRTIYYGWVLNYIVVSPTKDCLFSTMSDLYDVH